MPIVVFQNHPLETPGRLGQILGGHGQALQVCRTYTGDPLPVDLDDVDGLLILGGPMDVGGEAEHPWIPQVQALIQAAHDDGLPVVGICLGAQLIAATLGGEVGPMEAPEVGVAEVTSTFFGSTDPLLAGIPWNTPQFHLHTQAVTKAPPGGTPMPLQSSEACKVQAFRVGLTTYGFQYHFEWDRAAILEVLNANADLLQEHGLDPSAIASDLDDRYLQHRHFGDRLCQNLATLLYPIDKRLPPVGSDVTNFRN